MSTPPPAIADGTGCEIAIIGMAGRFPGAKDIEAFWRNLLAGVEAVTWFTDEQLSAKGVPPALLQDPSYVKAGILLEGFDEFDAGLFAYTPREATYLDPQQRLFLECAWQALEHAGYLGEGNAENAPLIGVYGGEGANLYLVRNLLPALNPGSHNDIAELLGLMNGNSSGSLCGRVAYKLNLRGPAVTVQSECSTSLVAVHVACNGLLSHDCDVALAGGVWINLLQESGYRHQPGAILSPDGHCRAFDAKAGGTLIGSGCGIVVLKRLSDALRDNDTIHAVIKGTAINNDGSDKIGFMAPSVSGQTEAIRAALMMADVPAETIGYVETHGTGTTLGDPIELAALTKAFADSGARPNTCAIGSVKTNIGHLDAAAGVAGLIKAVLVLKHATLPPSLNFQTPNSQIDFSATPFYVNTQARPWPRGKVPRRAGVSSFGIGGTNAHAVLEEAPSPGTPENQTEHVQLLRLSARSAPAVEAQARELAQYFEQHADLSLSDSAYTLCVGRRRFAERAVALGRNRTEVVRALRESSSNGYFRGRVLSEAPGVAFLFPGQGAQHLQMGRHLYETAPLFRETVDSCCRTLVTHTGVDLRELIYSQTQDQDAALLEQTEYAQPALFVVEYALAQLWMSWGVVPDALLGHSIGEYVAACLAGVFSLNDALRLVAARGGLAQACPRGAMLAVNLPEEDVAQFLEAGCNLAAVNSSNACVLSGSVDSIAGAERALSQRGVAVRRLRVSHAFHSALMEPALSTFASVLERVRMNAPRIPFVSNLTGRWITSEEVTQPRYWVEHLRRTVRFADGLSAVLSRPDRVLLEAGPGETLSALAKRHPHVGAQRPILSTLPHPNRPELQGEHTARCAAQLWIAGIEINAEAFCPGSARRRIPLPTYPFERQSYWIEPAANDTQPASLAKAEPDKPRSVADWFYVPAWRRIPVNAAAERSDTDSCTLVLGQDDSFTSELVQHLHRKGARVVRADRGEHFKVLNEALYALRPADRADHEQLLRHVEATHGRIAHIVHLWTVDRPGAPADSTPEQGFFSLLALAQALDSAGCIAGTRKVALTVVTSRVEDVSGIDPLCPEKASLQGACKVMPLEYPNLSCRVVDVIEPVAVDASEKARVEKVAALVYANSLEPVVAIRGPHTWGKRYEPLQLGQPEHSRLRNAGVYLITGGLGGVGLTIAAHLARAWQAHLVLVARSKLPPRGDWPRLMATAAPGDALRHKLQTLLELEAQGSDLLVLQADVTDADAMTAVVRTARERFGAIHGVIHAAGVAGAGMIAQRTSASMDQVWSAKIAGTRVLMQALSGAPLDFVLLCSSLTAVTGDFGQADYCAANCVLDAIAAQVAQRGDFPVLTVNWDAWRDVGMAAVHGMHTEAGLTPEQGAEAFEKLLSRSMPPQVIVSTIALDRQLARSHTLDDVARLLPSVSISRQRHARPALSSPFVEPAEGLERDLAELWSEVLGLAPIGVHDNLFELGGDSLLALQLLGKVRDIYGVQPHPSELLRTPTVAALAELIESRLIEEIESTSAGLPTMDAAPTAPVSTPH